MISEDGEWVECDQPGCNARHRNHRWGKIKAVDPGTGVQWFSCADGSGDFCPKHLPEWVPAWRESRNPRNVK